MGQCMTKTSVIMEDAYRSASESVSEIQRKISARNYTAVQQQDNIPLEPDNLTVGEKEIEDIFKDSIDDNI